MRATFFGSAWWILVVLPAVSSQGFLPVALSHAFPEGVPSTISSTVLSWADVDQDNLLDLSLIGGGAWLYHNEGNWSFSDMTTAFPGDSLIGLNNGIGGKWTDFNQDGFPDLLAWGQVGSDEFFVRLWRNNQGRNFTDVTSDLPALAPCQSSNDNDCMMEWGDFDGDNRVDLFIAHAYFSGGARTVCLNNGDQPTTFTEVDVSATFASTLGTGDSVG